MSRPGEDFQNFVASLERAISERDGATLESPKRLRDKDTNALREHDVIITWKSGHHEIITSIECKDQGRKVGVPMVEAFAKKCEKTGIHHGVIVSSSGFTQTALDKTEALNISCMTLTEAESFEWMGLEFFVEFRRQFSQLDLFVGCESMPDGVFTICNEIGAEVTSEHIGNIVESNVPFLENMEECLDVEIPIKIQIDTPVWTVKDQAGISHKLIKIDVNTSYKITRTAKPVTLHSYVGKKSEYQIASTDVDIKGQEGKIRMIKDDEGITVILQMDK